MGEVLRLEGDGEELLKDPRHYLSTSRRRESKQDGLLAALDGIIHFAITELNYYISNNGAEAFDYKSNFKSPK